MFFLLTVLSIEAQYTDIYVPCNISLGGGKFAKMDHCNVCASRNQNPKFFFSCIICEDGYELALGDNETYYYCKKKEVPTPKPETPKPETPKPETPKPETPKPETPKPETPKPETPIPETPIPETPEPEPPIPDNCPPCICDTALKSSTGSGASNNQMVLIMFIMTTIMFFMVSYIFCKEWKPIVCKCKKPDYGALQLTPPPSPPPPEQPPSVLPRFLPPSPTRNSSTTSEFSE